MKTTTVRVYIGKRSNGYWFREAAADETLGVHAVPKYMVDGWIALGTTHKRTQEQLRKLDNQIDC